MLTPPPKEKIKLFDHIDVHGHRIGVLRPTEDEESEIEIPETAQQERPEKNVTARVARVGPEVDHVEPGDKVMVSLFMQKPHQVAIEEDDDEEHAMFIIDADMAVATIHDQKEVVDEMF